jgi:hypothetical protein
MKIEPQLQWTLDQAIDLVRQLELKLKRVYNHYHVALGGSVLHKGFSNKDLDIIIYPHKTTHQGINWMKSALRQFGLVEISDRGAVHSGYGDDKDVIQYEYQNKRVDIFFLE